MHALPIVYLYSRSSVILLHYFNIILSYKRAMVEARLPVESKDPFFIYLSSVSYIKTSICWS